MREVVDDVDDTLDAASALLLALKVVYLHVCGEGRDSTRRPCRILRRTGWVCVAYGWGMTPACWNGPRLSYAIHSSAIFPSWKWKKSSPSKWIGFPLGAIPK